MEARAQPGRPGISFGCDGFSVKERISPSAARSMTPNAAGLRDRHGNGRDRHLGLLLQVLKSIICCTSIL